MRTPRVLTVALVALVVGGLIGGGLALATEHRGSLSSSGASPGQIPYVVAPDERVLTVSELDPQQPPLEPQFSLYGNGTVIDLGGPSDGALPGLRSLHVTSGGVQAILKQAADVGLFGPSRRYANGSPGAGSEVFAISAGG